MTLNRFLFVFAVLLVLPIQTVFGQTNTITDSLPSIPENLLVKQIRITGNKQISTSILKTIIKTQTNRDFLTIPNFRPWYWLWVVSKRFGEAPYPLNRDIISRDLDRLQSYYTAQGFLDVLVDTTIIQYNKTDVEVSFLIKEGSQSVIDTVIYSGLSAFDSENERQNFFKQSTLTTKNISDTLFYSGLLFNYDKLSTERDRIINHLRDKGFASVTRDSIRFLIKRDSIKRNELDILVKIQQGKIYYFGNSKLFLASPTGLQNYSEVQKKQFISQNTKDTMNLIVSKDPEAATDFDILFSRLLFKPGEIYNQSKYLSSVNKLQNLGIANLRRFSLSDNGGLTDYSSIYLPVFVDMQALPKNSMNLNLFGFQRFGLGAGAGLTFINRNLFGSAEQLQFGIKSSFEYATTDAQQQLLLSNEVTLGYSVPGLSFPFKVLNQKELFENSRTNYQIRYSRLNQFNFDIKANIGFNIKYESQHKASLASTLDLFEIDLVDAQATTDFEDQVLNNPNLTPLQQELILQDFRPQINSQIRYEIRNITTDIVKHDKGFYWDFSAEIGGTLPYLVDRYIASPDTVDNTIPSLDNIKLRYEQFVKLSFDYRKYTPLSNKSIFMYRLFTGYALPFGNSTAIPLVRRFFAGGAADIRGWAPATLGPGPIQDNVSQTNGGEIKLAAFAEFRQEIIQNFLASDWSIAFFVDSGNIWNGYQNPNIETQFHWNSFYNQIAVGSGFGLRLDFEYLIARLDLAFRIKEPVQSVWFRDSNAYFFFGIGHSF